MPEVQYNGYTLESISFWDQPEGKPGCWLAKARIMWREGPSDRQVGVGDPQLRAFETEEEANAFAHRLARAWVDGRG